MELMEKIKEVTEKVKGDPNFAEEFKKDPVKALENVLDVDLPDEMVNNVIDGVKAQLAGTDVLGALNNLFHKK